VDGAPEVVRSLLEPDEVTRWVGHPGIRNRRGVSEWSFLVLGGLLVGFGAFAVLALAFGAPLPLGLLAVMCLAAGYFALRVPRLASRVAEDTWYVVTDRRVVIAPHRDAAFDYPAPLPHLRISPMGRFITVGLKVIHETSPVHRRSTFDWLRKTTHPGALLLVEDTPSLRTALEHLRESPPSRATRDDPRL